MDTTAKIAALIGVRAHLAAKVERMNAKLATLDAEIAALQSAPSEAPAAE